VRANPTVAWSWVKFECYADAGSDVYIGGTFNRWKPSGLDKMRDRKHVGRYRTLLQLKKGRHEYRFLVNGTWLTNPDLPQSGPDTNVPRNNVVDVL
jgi:1,4-alpha-glucan branching enzyme